MHCSANMDEHGRVALFFGLSGTGKTTLSADPQRRLMATISMAGAITACSIRGWVLRQVHPPSQEKEPQIWNAIRFGQAGPGKRDDGSGAAPARFDSDELTENTRAAYGVNFIDNAVLPGVGAKSTAQLQSRRIQHLPKRIAFQICGSFSCERWMHLA